jgi:alpha-1,2-mannosyltransferase
MSHYLIIDLLHATLVVLALLLLLRGERWPRGRRWLWCAGIGAALLAVALVVRVSEPRYLLMDDYNKAYLPAGRTILDRPTALYDDVAAEAKRGNLTFVNVPIVAALYAPLALCNYPVGLIVYHAIGAAAVLAAWLGLVRLTGATGFRALALLALLATNGPLWYSVKEGNLTHFLLPVLVGVLYFIDRKRDFAAGVCLAVAGVIKLPLFLLVVYFLWRRRGRVMHGFAATLGVTALLSLALFGWDLHVRWWSECIAPFSGRPMTAYNVQSLAGFLGRCLTDGPLSEWVTVDADARFKLVYRGLLLGIFAIAALAVLRRGTTLKRNVLFTEYSIALCLSLIASPITWTHYYTFLLIPGALYLGKALEAPGRAWLVLLGGGVLLFSLPVLPTDGRAHDWRRIYASAPFFGGLMVLAALLRTRFAAGRVVTGQAIPQAGEGTARRAAA